MEKVHLIAEAGSNYNGELQKAKELAEIAKRAGADSVKFQMINTYGLYLPGQYEYGHYDIKEVLNFRDACNLPEADWDEIYNYCKELGIVSSSSVFDKVSMDILIKHDPEYVKIASSDLNNIKFLLEIAEYGKKLIISTGMASLQEIDNTVNFLYKNNVTDIVLMHCVSAYPADLEDMNLGFIDTLKSAFGFDTGFSDHTKNSIAACLALTKGVKYIEKHFTMDTSLPGLDHKHAMDEVMLTNYITDIRNAEKALTFKINKTGDKEEYTKKRARRALYAAVDIKKGTILTEDHIIIVRPQGPIPADRYYDVIGKAITKDIKKFQALSFDMIS